MPVLPPAAGGPRAPELVGRAPELDALERALDDARAGTSGAVLVEADAGVGKSRLVAELADRARARGGTVLVGHCASAGGGALPYLPFVEALEPLRRSAAQDWWFGDRPGSGEPGLSQLQLFDAVAGVLAAAARGSEVLLVLEDLHWADGASLGLLTFLLRRLRGERLLVVATVRTDDLHRRHPLRPVLAELARLPAVRRVVLDPFDVDEMRRFLRALAGHDPDPATLRRIHQRAEGNAYYAAELLLAGPGRDGRLPSALADVVIGRVESLPAEVADLVRAAAVGGRRVRHDLLRAATGAGEDDVERAVRAAVTAGVLDVDGQDGYAFHHALLHEAVYEDLLPGERVRLHAAFARVVADSAAAGRPLASAAELAHHARRSHDLAGALVAGIAAADEAERLRAPAEAWHHVEEALPLWDAVPDAAARTGTTLMALTVRASELARTAGDPARSALLARGAVDLLPADAAPAVAAEVHRQCAAALWACDRDEEALEQARAAQRRGGEDPAAAPAVCWATAIAARCFLHLDRFAESRREAERALALAAAGGLAGAEADALTTLGGLDNLAGALADADALFARAARAAERAGHLETALRARYNRAADRYDRGDLPGATQVLDDSCAWAASVGLTWAPYGMQLLSLQVTASAAGGEFDRALRQARAVGPQAPPQVATAVGVVAARVLAARGAFEEALAALDPAWLDDPDEGLSAALARAEVLRWRGEPAAAAEVLVAALFSFRGVEHPSHLLGLRLGALAVAALADVGRGGDPLVERVRARVLDLVAVGQPRAGVLGPEGRAWVAVLHAEVARARGVPAPEQVTAWRAAVEGFTGGDVLELARCRWRLAEACAAAGLREEGLLALDEARRAASRLRAVPLSTVLEDLARRVRASASPGRGPLTARELQVLDLLAAGRTNRQVGEQLFMAEKTASVHVSRIFAKLGASSRAEAVSIGLRGGLLHSSPADQDRQDT
ncbi:DNA-binding CsgD family transcriptional regulator/tetratricopeptide (TPR) repeat protein [Kineococcus radiotolerans]|uniref:DNA-binding CsgD family transcriptional regulator/tetratricopeptide (TPR) repeat protein n=1 Tax=Kineococcus radiotolerans TaxID=131568 RepID=A0A7W4TKG5_KINRA|nr:LuxR family transcriptional regulator [Kineococcus radiotolerans]MBB2900579.1 DNA-binding CsgD family transcriptional regulator/tetratricopeptide (TPR) repeat protein [Kineococcus radiotolerans]